MRNPVLIAIGTFFNGDPHTYRIASSKTAAVRWLRARGWRLKDPRHGLLAFAERADTQEWARVIAAPPIEQEAPDA